MREKKIGIKMALEEISSVKMYEGFQKVFSHVSAQTKTKMTFGVFLPKQVNEGKDEDRTCVAKLSTGRGKGLIPPYSVPPDVYFRLL